MATACGRMMAEVLFQAKPPRIEPSIGSAALLFEPAMMRLASSA
jgi:Na+-transporting methylmalonyl-CoA/oxaloacetate decarboxylase beta subunit